MTDWRKQAKAFLEPWYLQTPAHHKDPLKHAEDVVQALEVQLHQTDPEILTAGMLHDLLEDTNATPAHIEEAFSARVAALVQEVSHEKTPDFDRDAFCQHLGSISIDAKMIKFAEFYANLEWMQIQLANENPVFQNHEPYMRHVKIFSELSVDPIFDPIKKKIMLFCNNIRSLQGEAGHLTDMEVNADY